MSERAVRSLDYAPKTPLMWGRRAQRIAGILFLCLIVVCGWKWGRQRWGIMEALYWQRACLEWKGPADPVFDTSETIKGTLRSRGGGWRVVTPSRSWKDRTYRASGIA